MGPAGWMFQFEKLGEPAEFRLGLAEKILVGQDEDLAGRHHPQRPVPTTTARFQSPFTGYFML